MVTNSIGLEVKCSIFMEDTSCLKCTSIIKSNHISVTGGALCTCCGAKYKYYKYTINNNETRCIFKFKEFVCTYKEYFVSNICGNSCPGPNLWCKDHVTNETLRKINTSILNTKARLSDLEAQLEKIKDSKKVWLIKKISDTDGYR